LLNCSRYCLWDVYSRSIYCVSATGARLIFTGKKIWLFRYTEKYIVTFDLVWMRPDQFQTALFKNFLASDLSWSESSCDRDQIGYPTRYCFNQVVLNRPPGSDRIWVKTWYDLIRCHLWLQIKNSIIAKLRWII